MPYSEFRYPQKGYHEERMEYEVLGNKLPVKICVGESGEFYHVTDLESLKKILKEGKLRPVKPENQWDVTASNSVSFSVNPKQPYGSGNIVMVFSADKVNYLKPMHYYDVHELERLGIPRYIDNDYSYEKKIPNNEASAILGITSDVFSRECEWYAMSEVPANSRTIKRIIFFIPWRIISRNRLDSRFDCERSVPHYAAFDNMYRFGLEDLLAWIHDTIKTGIDYNISVYVESQFPYIRLTGMEYPSNAVIEFTKENLKSLSMGQKPVISFIGKEREEKEECV